MKLRSVLFNFIIIFSTTSKSENLSSKDRLQTLLLRNRQDEERRQELLCKTDSNVSINTLVQNPSTNPSNKVHPFLTKLPWASLSIIYFLLTWRAMGCYDSSGQFSISMIRTLSNVPVTIIFVLNILGVIISIVNPLKLRVQLKLILAINTLREIIELMYNVIMIIISTSVSKFNRDFYYGRMIASIYFLTLCVSTSRIRWMEQKDKTS
jgi:hypothetical protein